MSVALPAVRIFSRQRHLSASPPSIAASLDPVVEVPVTSPFPSACHSRPMMFTQRRSISAVCGYSSLSIMFLSAVSAMIAAARGGIHVVTKVARFSRALPSSSSSLDSRSYATSDPVPVWASLSWGRPCTSASRTNADSVLPAPLL